MWIIHRRYNDTVDDFTSLCRFVTALGMSDHTTLDWSLGRVVDWKYGLWNTDKNQPDFFQRNAHLWTNYYGDLLAVVISENGDNKFALLVKSSYGFLCEQMLEWVDLNWREERGPLSTMAAAQDIEKLACLDKSGYERSGEAERTYIYDIDSFQIPQVGLADGYRIEGMDSNGDFEAQVRLKNEAFRNNAPLPPWLRAAYSHVKTSPLYDPHMDLVVVDQAGEHVAGAEGFIDYENHTMQVERVCTRSTHRRQGFAKAVIGECVRRARVRGVKRVTITAWNEGTTALYGSFGASRAISRFQYVK